MKIISSKDYTPWRKRLACAKWFRQAQPDNVLTMKPNLQRHRYLYALLYCSLGI